MHVPRSLHWAPLGVLVLVVMTSAIPAPPTTTLDPRSEGFFPSPQEHTFQCGHSGRSSWVCDPENLLREETVLKADDIIESIRNSTACQCGRCAGSGEKGFPIGVAVLRAVPGSEEEGMPMHSGGSELLGNQMADSLRTRYWKLGKCGDDIVLLLSMKDGRIYISPGGVAQRVFHYQCELEVGHAYMTFVRQTHRDDHDGGLIAALQDIKTIMTQDRKCLSRAGPLLQWWHLLILSLVVVLVVMVVMSTVMVIRRFRRRFR